MAATETTAAPDAATAADAKPPKAPGVMMPILAVFVLMPALAYGLTVYVLIPKLQAAMPAATGSVEPGAAGAKKEGKTEAAPAAHASAKKEGDSKKGAESASDASFEFKDVIVNLSGALGTRYLKASFTVSGSDSHLPDIAKENHQKLLDITISVLSSRTLNDLDSPTAKNAIREELIAKYNHALGVDLIEELYFSEFVIQ